MRYADDQMLDDLDALSAADPGDMLRATADAGAQVRRAISATDEAALQRIAADGRPRAVLVAGMGGSGISGDVLAAVCGSGCPVAITTLRSYVLPGWVGPLDLVIAVSCSGRTEETLSVAAEAVKRGARLVGVGAAGSPLHDLVRSASGAEFIVSVPRSVLDHAADVLDERSVQCGPASPLADNPAKLLGVELAASLPMVWGTSPVGAVSAYRLACQLNENAKLPVIYGAIPEATHNQIVAFDGNFVGAADADIFRDPVEDGPSAARVRLVLFRDSAEHPQDARRAEIAAEIAERRGASVDVLSSPEAHAVVRLASLTGLGDWASVYAAIALGVDPSPIAPIMELKDRIS